MIFKFKFTLNQESLVIHSLFHVWLFPAMETALVSGTTIDPGLITRGAGGHLCEMRSRAPCFWGNNTLSPWVS